MQGLQGQGRKVLREEGLHPASYRELDAVQNVGLRVSPKHLKHLHRYRNQEALPQGMVLEANAKGHREI